MMLGKELENHMNWKAKYIQKLEQSVGSAAVQASMLALVSASLAMVLVIMLKMLDFILKKREHRLKELLLKEQLPERQE